MSFHACIVTITWSRLFLDIALWVIYPTRQITLTILSSSDLRMLVCFLVFHRLTRKQLVLLTDLVSSLNTFIESACLARKCGTRRGDIPLRAL
jgi:hypothetical protein